MQFGLNCGDIFPEYDEDYVDMEFSVYDVTPDVSIDFVSFTTEESEGRFSLLSSH